ncbi:Putative porin [bacterium A37T11]|nr:Putative porin [bacterium A37T11]
MRKHLRAILFCLLIAFTALPALAQIEEGEWSTDLDSMRKAEDNKEDSIIFTAKFIRYTTLDRMKEGTYTVGIDTSLRNFQYFNPQNDPWNPSINLGNYGLATRDLLFNPSKKIGFDPGFHSLDRYLLNPDSTKYYRARARFSELYYVTAPSIFRAALAQNIHERLSIGAEFNASVANGSYQNQRYNDYRAAINSWYESANHRYNLLTNVVFNSLVATENGSVLNDTLFRNKDRDASASEYVRLTGARDDRPRNAWKDNSFFMKQTYFLGRIDTLNARKEDQIILPTNRVAHTLRIRQQQFKFYKNESDENGAFPFGQSVLTQDSTHLTTISNEFGYSFYLRGNSLSFIKNEVKLDLGLEHDLYWYRQMTDKKSFQNITIKGGAGYKFSDRINFNLNVDQIVTGRNFGDYMYEANANILLGNKIGNIVLGAYTQNKSPEYLMENINYTYHQWNRELDKTKTTNMSFSYENPKIGFSGKAEYYLVNNYLYYKEVDNPDHDPLLMRLIEPTQFGSSINMLKLTVGQLVKFGRFSFNNMLVYQKSNEMAVLRTPEIYTWHSFYYTNILVQIINYNIGFDVHFNKPFVAPSYAIDANQFYNDNVGTEFSSYPIVDFWLTATLKKTNFFLRYDYANQGLFSQGYYTVRRYPMNNASFRFGVSWNFYDK